MDINISNASKLLNAVLVNTDDGVIMSMAQFKNDTQNIHFYAFKMNDKTEYTQLNTQAKRLHHANVAFGKGKLPEMFNGVLTTKQFTNKKSKKVIQNLDITSDIDIYDTFMIHSFHMVKGFFVSKKYRAFTKKLRLLRAINKEQEAVKAHEKHLKAMQDSLKTETAHI